MFLPFTADFSGGKEKERARGRNDRGVWTGMDKFAFIADLDEYFCEKYADYDRLCVLKGYIMPKMQSTMRREDGTDYSYTLPAETMRLATQPNKEDLLSQLKGRMTDYTFSFSFRPLGFFEKLRCNRSRYAFKRVFAEVCAKYSLTTEAAIDICDVSEKTKTRILKGVYYPTKNLLFTVILACGFSMDDAETLMRNCGFSFDYTLIKDVVISYLIANKVFNAEMIEAALEEYNVDGLFFREAD